MNITHSDVYRTAPAKPCLINTITLYENILKYVQYKKTQSTDSIAAAH